MANFQTLRDLTSEGKLHRPLLIRLKILLAISAALLLVVIYQIGKETLNVWMSLGIAFGAFLLGLFLFSKMTTVKWDEEKEVIATERMDKFGFGILLLYIVFEVGLRTILKMEFGGTFAATGYLLAGIGGSLLGRSVGDLVAIHKLAKSENFAG